MKKSGFSIGILIHIVIWVISCHPSENPRTEIKSDNNKENNIVNQNKNSLKEIRSNDVSINYTDSNGLKQGKWIRKYKGKIVEVSHYKNDTLHGDYADLDGIIEEGYYHMGELDSLYFVFYGDGSSCMVVFKYQNGKHIWSACPASGKKSLIPLKWFEIFVDSAFINAPYANGQIWYEGNFYRKKDSTDSSGYETYATGIHKVYHEDGFLKGIINYENESIREFDNQGNLMYNISFNEIDSQKIFKVGKE